MHALKQPLLICVWLRKACRRGIWTRMARRVGKCRLARRALPSRARAGRSGCAWRVRAGRGQPRWNGNDPRRRSWRWFPSCSPARSSRMRRSSWQVSTLRWRRRMDEHADDGTDDACCAAPGRLQRRRAGAADRLRRTRCRRGGRGATGRGGGVGAPEGSHTAPPGHAPLSLCTTGRPGGGRTGRPGCSAWADAGRLRPTDRAVLFHHRAWPVRYCDDECRLEPERQGGVVWHLPRGGLPDQLRGAARLCCHWSGHGCRIALDAADRPGATWSLVCGLAAAWRSDLPGVGADDDLPPSVRYAPGRQRTRRWGAGRVFRRAAAALQDRAERDLRAADSDGGGAVLGWLAGATAAASALVHRQNHHAQRLGALGKSLRTAAATRPDAHARVEDPLAGFAREHSAGGHPRAAAAGRWHMSGVVEWVCFL